MGFCVRLTTACKRLGAPRLGGRAFKVRLVFVSTGFRVDVRAARVMRAVRPHAEHPDAYKLSPKVMAHPAPAEADEYPTVDGRGRGEVLVSNRAW